MTALRWWANNTRRSEVVAASNDHYGIDRRTYVATHSKAAQLDHDALKTDFEARMAISAELGHGREEVTTIYLGR